MFLKVVGDMLPHGIKYDLDAFCPRDLDCRHEVAVARNYDNLVDNALEREGNEIKAEPHVDALLPHIKLQVLSRELRYGLSSF